MGKFLAFILGLAGAAAGSQAPGFTQLYMTNLSGRIAELKPIVEQFDADVARYGYTREGALAECGTAEGLLNALCDGYENTILRYEDLLSHKTELDAASDWMRPVTLVQTFRHDIAEDVAGGYKPVVPVTVESAAYTGGGFVGLWGIASILFGILGLPFRGRDPEGKWA